MENRQRLTRLALLLFNADDDISVFPCLKSRARPMMTMDLHDTIVAPASAPGPGARAIVRLSGPDSLRIALTVFEPDTSIDPARRWMTSGAIRLPGVNSPMPALLLVWPGPRSYTGQDMAEVHTVSCPPLVDLLVAELMNAGARAAGPGEFTMRAFLAGKRDLPRAEAVQAVVSAANREELTQALAQLAGGMTRPLDGLRDDLLNLLADVEAGLDFSEEDIQFVDSTQVLNRLAAGLARLTLVQRQLESRADAGHAFRAVLAGAPNAGKSSLFNALVGADAALVSDRPGTTRDYIVKRLELDGVAVELADTAGWQQIDDDIERQAQQFGDEQRRRADLILVCVEAGREIGNDEAGVLRQARPEAILIRTKCDLINRVTGDGINTSAQTGVGIPELREALARAARARTASGLASSQSRCRHHVSAALEALRRAHSAVLFEDPPEVLALEIRNGLDALGALTGAIHTDDLLDRVFSRFCIGK